MDFGKLANIEHVDFSLKEDPDFNERSFEMFADKPVLPKQLYIGAPVWNLTEWVGSYYPQGAKSKDFFYHYSRQFNTIELNSSFYGIPKISNIQNWYQQSPDDFRFCPKVFKGISHSKNLGTDSDIIDKFIDVINILDDKLGFSYLQLPETSGVNYTEAVFKFIDKINNRVPLAIEFRHPDWFIDSDDTFNKLRDLNVSNIITDVAGRRDVCHMYVTNQTVMIRFGGNMLHLTDYERIDNWIDRMIYWFESGVNNIYFMMHESDKWLTSEVAIYLGQNWKKKSNIPVRYPIIKTDPEEQLKLF